jgi:hypothetical protein
MATCFLNKGIALRVGERTRCWWKIKNPAHSKMAGRRTIRHGDESALPLGETCVLCAKVDGPKEFHSGASVPVTLVSKILGHTNLTTTSRYLNIHRRGLHAAMEKLEAHRPAVAQPLHTKEPDAQAGVPGSDTPAPPETSRLQ